MTLSFSLATFCQLNSLFSFCLAFSFYLVSHAHPSQEASWANPVFPNHSRLLAPYRRQI